MTVLSNTIKHIQRML